MLQDEFTSSKTKSLEVRAAQFAPLSLWSDIRGPKHFVQFYQADTYLVMTIADYVLAGLNAGETCIIVATDKHLAMLEGILGQDTDLVNVRGSGRFVTLDAEQILAEIMVDDMPDALRLRDLIEPYLIKATKGGAGIRCFGEMVTILGQRGNYEASQKLEEIWNDLREDYVFALFCSYPTKLFSSFPTTNRVHICDEHAVIIPDESYTSLKTGVARLSKIASLQQRIQELEAELAANAQAQHRR